MDVFARARAKGWSRVPALIDDWTEKCAAPARALQRSVADVYTRGDVGIYWSPALGRAGLFFRGNQDKQAQDLALVTGVVTRAAGRPQILDFQNVNSGYWVKVAYSPALRRAGELLNFFPGNYPGGIPNAPSPLAATLTGGLVGAGMGYGLGALGERLLPNRWQKGRLRKTLAIAGGLGLAAPGAAGMAVNAWKGKGVLDGSALRDNASKSGVVPDTVDPADISFKQAMDVLAEIKLGRMYTEAVRQFTKLAEDEELRTLAPEYGKDPLRVDINRMGQVLWDTGASPQIAATTMGALYAAQQMPDHNAEPGYATPHQTGLMGTMMAAAGGGLKGYAAGYMVGKALGLLTGMPSDTQNTLSNSGAVLGVIDAVVPRLFH